jgi:hypothetical protein
MRLVGDGIHHPLRPGSDRLSAVSNSTRRALPPSAHATRTDAVSVSIGPYRSAQRLLSTLLSTRESILEGDAPSPTVPVDAGACHIGSGVRTMKKCVTPCSSQ